MSAYLEAVTRLAEEYKADVRAVEAAQQRIAEYEAALPELREIRKEANVVVSVCFGKVSVFFSCGDKDPVGVPVPRAMLAAKPLYNWNGFDVI